MATPTATPKNHALLCAGPRPSLAPIYDALPVLIDDQVTHELAFDIGCAKLTDEITRAGLDAFIRALGFPRVTPALLNRLKELVTAAVVHIPEMSGPTWWC